MTKTYLRVVFPKKIGENEWHHIFEGNIKEDKAYWNKCGNKVKYFEIKEVKV